MNKKGAMEAKSPLGLIVIVAITLVVGLILFQSIAQEVGKSTNTEAYGNTSLATVVNGTPQYITTCRGLENVIVWNQTDAAGFAANGSAIQSGNYTITDNVINPTTGALSVRVDPTASVNFKNAWKVQGTCQPLTYIANSGARSMASLIAIFFALAIAVIALTPTLRSGLLEMIGR